MTNNINSTNTINNETILKNSMTYLEQYRKIQAQQLNIRLNVFKQAVISKYGSIDKMQNENGSPIESQLDIDIIERLIELRTFTTLPVYATTNPNTVTHCYTLGLWYYWGLPELVITFETPISDNIEFVNIITNIIHDELFFMFKNKIVKRDITDKINRNDYKQDTINIVLDKFDLEFKLKKIHQENYLDAKVPYMMWFYMYYMDAIKDKKNEPKLYPMYKLSLNEANYRGVCKKVIDILIAKSLSSTNTINTVSDQDSSDSTDSDRSIECVNDIAKMSLNDTEILNDDITDDNAQSQSETVAAVVPFIIKKKYW